MAEYHTLMLTTSVEGCRWYRVTFDRIERPVPWQQRTSYPEHVYPAEQVTAAVVVPPGTSIEEVLEYHYPDTWMNLRVTPDEDPPSW